MSRWEEVDEPVLRWLAARPSSFIHSWALDLGIRREIPACEEIPGLDERDVDGALTRLKGHGLIDGNRQESIEKAYWSRLRVTGLGLQILGEWPDLDRLSQAAGLRLLLTKIADESDDPDEQQHLRRLVGFMGSVGDGIVDQTVRDALGAGVDELKEDL